MSDGDSCQDIESDEDEEISNGRKKVFLLIVKLLMKENLILVHQ